MGVLELTGVAINHFTAEALDIDEQYFLEVCKAGQKFKGGVDKPFR